MASGGQRRTRSERVAALELPPGQWERAWIGLRRRDVWGRVALAFLAAVIVTAIIRGWDPPVSWRAGRAPVHFITARVTFEQEDPGATEAARQRKQNEVKFIFVQDPQPLVRLRGKLHNAIADLTKAETLTDANRAQWREFLSPAEKAAAAEKSSLPEKIAVPEKASGGKTSDDKISADKISTDKAAADKPPSPPKVPADVAEFQAFRKAVGGKENLDHLDLAVQDAFSDMEKHGVLGQPSEELMRANQAEITVYPVGNPSAREDVQVSKVLFDKDKADKIRRDLEDRLDPKVADHLYAWFQYRNFLPEPPEPGAIVQPLTTLTRDKDATEKAREAAAEQVKPVVLKFNAGEPIVAVGEKIDDKKLDLIKLEYQAFLEKRTLATRLERGGAVLMLIFTMFLICGACMRYRQSGPLASLDRLIGMLVMAIATVGLSLWGANEPWRAEIVPLILFGMTMAIAYRQEMALLLSGVLTWIIVLALGNSITMFLLLFGTTAAAALNLGRIRSRSKLIYVGLFTGGVAALLSIAMGMIDNQPFDLAMLQDAARHGVWGVAAGFIMTGLLPFIEQVFGVLTDLSLLELGDITHPLLQELVRRAPSTYNHSLTVGSIGEAAADAIGARGLLVRVGAYFHDIGKMLKPGYFVENQGKEASRHESLVPAMSTLVIIAHIKDGSDLARQHHLPQPIIDLILQHHGTMLMEYFYDRAHEQKGSDPHGAEVDENLFRYPGPKPQTKEAAVLMLADAIESASRSLVDPTPARIESLVRELAQRRLQGGQFDESGLTLLELGTIQRTLAMSVASIYHGRLKYPEQKTA